MFVTTGYCIREDTPSDQVEALLLFTCGCQGVHNLQIIYYVYR